MSNRKRPQRVSIWPSAEFCFGRNQLADTVISSAIDCQSVLLYGGRQAGKTTFLKLIESNLDKPVASGQSAGVYNLGVYLNLQMLPFDAVPTDFYSLAITELQKKCRRLISDFDFSVTESKCEICSSVDEFQTILGEIWRTSGGVFDGFVFLLDESKRILGRRFSRGFQDNLFALLYGTQQRYRLSMVFSGAQDLHLFLEDDTSPIGSRAAVHMLRNLEKRDILHMLDGVNISAGDDLFIESVAESIYEITGGHAGISARFVERWANSRILESKDLDAEGIGALLVPQLNTLFQHWNRNFTPEATVALDILHTNRTVCLSEVAFGLENNSFSRFRSEMVCNELQYVGVAIESGVDEISQTNSAYWNYRNRFQPKNTTSVSSDKSRSTWGLIEETESTLRIFIRSKYSLEWPNRFYNIMQSILGLEAWEKLERLKNQSDNYYPYLRNKKNREIMECMHLGQLIELMVNNRSWYLFREYFRDKRHLQDMARSIIPVRNDRAHFVDVADKEMDRCRISCDDLLVIVEKELGP